MRLERSHLQPPTHHAYRKFELAHHKSAEVRGIIDNQSRSIIHANTKTVSHLTFVP